MHCCCRSWSGQGLDRLQTRWGGRLPFVMAGAPVAVVALVAMGFVHTVGGLAVAVAVFFAGYFVAYEPYRALYPDLVSEAVAGRAQSTQAVWRGTGTLLALLGGGLLLAQSQAAPFIVAALLLAASIGLFLWLAARGDRPERPRAAVGVRETIADMFGLLRHDPALRAFFFANAAWELALGALKTFVILWLTRGLGVGLSSAALLIGAVGVLILVGAAGTSGALADRFGRRRVMSWAVIAFGVPMAVPLLRTPPSFLILLAGPLIAVGGGVLMSLPYALLQPLMPDERRGALTGFYSASRGVGVMLGPVLGGLAVSAAGGVLASTEGYAAVWGVCRGSGARVTALDRTRPPRRRRGGVGSGAAGLTRSHRPASSCDRFLSMIAKRIIENAAALTV